jgi:hypothetical protein
MWRILISGMRKVAKCTSQRLPGPLRRDQGRDEGSAGLKFKIIKKDNYPVDRNPAYGNFCGLFLGG